MGSEAASPTRQPAAGFLTTHPSRRVRIFAAAASPAALPFCRTGRFRRSRASRPPRRRKPARSQETRLSAPGSARAHAGRGMPGRPPPTSCNLVSLRPAQNIDHMRRTEPFARAVDRRQDILRILGPVGTLGRVETGIAIAAGLDFLSEVIEQGNPPATVLAYRSKSRARRRLRLIQANVRSTIQRFGSATKRCASVRLTISSFQQPVVATVAAILGPWYGRRPYGAMTCRCLAVPYRRWCPLVGAVEWLANDSSLRRGNRGRSGASFVGLSHTRSWGRHGR